MALLKLLGEKVIRLEGGNEVEVDVKSLQGEGKVLGIYFSAHWCPPCRAFTPQLAKWYKKITDGIVGDKFTIVFVSSDRDEESFKDYFKEMPWLALPFSERERKAELSKKFKVAGIPTLVLVNAETGKTITGDGRSIVMEDENGKDFPWTPKPFAEVIRDGCFKGQRGKELNSDAINGKVLGIYFSAHWCGPCRGFTPQLVETYKKLKAAEKNFEIVFVSSDKDDNEWKKYFDTMPWIALPFGDKRKKILSRMFDVQGIPTLVIVNQDGQVINTGGRAALGDDPEGAKFPWYPEPVRCLTGSTAGDINDSASLIWFNEEKPSEESLKVMKPIAEAKIAEAKAADEDPMMFYVVGKDTSDDDDIASSLRNFAGLGKTNPLLVIIDIPSQKVFINDAGEINADTIKQYVTGYYSKAIEGKPLKA